MDNYLDWVYMRNIDMISFWEDYVDVFEGEVSE